MSAFPSVTKAEVLPLLCVFPCLLPEPERPGSSARSRAPELHGAQVKGHPRLQRQDPHLSLPSRSWDHFLSLWYAEPSCRNPTEASGILRLSRSEDPTMSCCFLLSCLVLVPWNMCPLRIPHGGSRQPLSGALMSPLLPPWLNLRGWGLLATLWGPTQQHNHNSRFVPSEFPDFVFPAWSFNYFPKFRKSASMFTLDFHMFSGQLFSCGFRAHVFLPHPHHGLALENQTTLLAYQNLDSHILKCLYLKLSPDLLVLGSPCSWRDM